MAESISILRRRQGAICRFACYVLLSVAAGQAGVADAFCSTYTTPGVNWVSKDKVDTKCGTYCRYLLSACYNQDCSTYGRYLSADFYCKRTLGSSAATVSRSPPASFAVSSGVLNLANPNVYCNPAESTCSYLTSVVCCSSSVAISRPRVNVGSIAYLISAEYPTLAGSNYCKKKGYASLGQVWTGTTMAKVVDSATAKVVCRPSTRSVPGPWYCPWCTSTKQVPCSYLTKVICAQ